MSPRFFIDTRVSKDRIQLTGSERQHLVGALRGKVGDRVTLFDGSGLEYTARIVGIGRSAVDLEVVAGREVDREVSIPITLGVALPKGDRQHWLVEKAVELGVHRLVPLSTDRGVAQPVPRALERLRRWVIEAAKQCGRNRLMSVDSPVAGVDYFRQAPDGSLRVVAHPVDPAISLADVALVDRAVSVYLAVGPEGGFTERELSAAVDWQTVNLGPRILRVETAAVVLAAHFALQAR